MKRNYKGLIAICICALIAIGGATATVMVLTDTYNDTGKFANTTIDVDDNVVNNLISGTTNAIPLETAEEANSDAARSIVQPEVNNMPTQTITVNSGSNSAPVDDSYLYGDYLKEVETFIMDYLEYYNPEESFNKTMFANANFTLNALQTPKMTSFLYDAVGVEDNYKDDDIDNNFKADDKKDDLLMTMSVSDTVGSFTKEPTLKLVASNKLANNNFSGVGSLAVRDFIKWHLGEENNKNIKAAYNQLANVNVSNDVTWYAFCDLYAEYRYTNLYSEAVDTFTGYFLDEYTLPGAEDVLTLTCAANSEPDFYDADADNNDMDKANDVDYSKKVDSFELADSNVKYANKVNVEAIAEMSEADFNKFAKKEILAMLDSNFNKLLLTKSTADSDFTKIRDKFYDSFLKQYDNVYTAYMNLVFVNCNTGPFYDVADKFYDDLAIEEYETQVADFLDDFADEYGIATLGDVNEVLKQRKAAQEASINTMPELQSAMKDCLQNQMFEDQLLEEIPEEDDDEDEAEDDEVDKAFMDECKKDDVNIEEKCDKVDIKNEELDKAANNRDQASTTLKDVFISWHTGKYSNSDDMLDDTLDEILYINRRSSSDEWSSFAGDFYYYLTGILPEKHVAAAVAETIEAAATTEEKAVEKLSAKEIKNWEQIVGAILDDNSKLSMMDDVMTLSMNTMDYDDIRSMIYVCSNSGIKSAIEAASQMVLAVVEKLEVFYGSIDQLITTLNNDLNTPSTAYSIDEVRALIADYIETDYLPYIIEKADEINSDSSAYGKFVAFIKDNYVDENINNEVTKNEVAGGVEEMVAEAPAAEEKAETPPAAEIPAEEKAETPPVAEVPAEEGKPDVEPMKEEVELPDEKE